MYAKTIKYKDYFGTEKSEEFLFNISKAEVFDMQFSTKGGLETIIRGIINTKDVNEMGKIFKKIILMSYGEVSGDGKKFLKSEERSREFEQSAAYDALYTELLTDSNAASEFINKVIPVAEIEELIKKSGNNPAQPVQLSTV